MKKLLLLCLLISFASAKAQCLQQLREANLLKIVSEAKYAVGRDAKKLTKDLTKTFVERIKSFGTKEEMYSKKSSEYSKKLQEFIEKEIGPEGIRDVIREWRDGMHDVNRIKEWMESIHRDSVFEIYASKDQAKIAEFESTKKVPEAVLLDVLKRRLKDGEFKPEDFTEVNSSLSETAFGEILKAGKPIIDLPFKGGNHGHFIHVLHVDMMLFFSRQKGIDLGYVLEAYKWMGKDMKYDLPSGSQFRSIKDAWFSLADSFENDVSKPETLNPIIERYLGWRN